ncbi:MAG TPA: hypothetical protein VJ226_14155, partial [Bradyrhizobium sp.]|nr:hypothetical protein [Bradyrhizobium sp.]
RGRPADPVRASTTKNLWPTKGLASFARAVDCAPSNNRLKRPTTPQRDRETPKSGFFRKRHAQTKRYGWGLIQFLRISLQEIFEPERIAACAGIGSQHQNQDHFSQARNQQRFA